MTLLHAGDRLAVLVCSDQSLVVDAVCAALVGHGLEATGIVGFDEDGGAAAGDHDVALMVADLDDATTTTPAVALTHQRRLPWLVVAETSEPTRARLEDAGATTLPATTTLRELVPLIVRIAERGRDGAAPRHRLT